MFEVKTAVNLGNFLGEGPVWCTRDQILYWLDIKLGTVFSFDPESKQTEHWDIGDMIAVATPVAGGGGLLIAAQGALSFLSVVSGQITKLCDLEKELPDNRPNDGKVDAMGRLWFGTTDDRETHTSGYLYCYGPVLSPIKMASGIGNPNTFAWSPDNMLFYSADSVEQTMYVYDFDLTKGAISNKREFFSLKGTNVIPDGSTVDAEGYLWNAQWNGWRVVRYAPDGTVDQVIDMPVACPTSCMFGGPDLKTLYVTSARKGQSEQALAAQPLAGALFSIDLDVAGLPETPFKL